MSATGTRHLRRRLHKSCRDGKVRSLILRAIDAGARCKMTKGGVMLFGPDGIATIHFTGSDSRACANAEADIRRIGIELR